MYSPPESIEEMSGETIDDQIQFDRNKFRKLSNRNGRSSSLFTNPSTLVLPSGECRWRNSNNTGRKLLVRRFSSPVLSSFGSSGSKIGNGEKAVEDGEFERSAFFSFIENTSEFGITCLNVLLCLPSKNRKHFCEFSN